MGIFAAHFDADEERVLVKSYGSNLVVNGGFVADVNWTKGIDWTIPVTEVLLATNVGASTRTYQAGVFVIGKTYRLIYSVLNWVSGQVRIRCGYTNGIVRSANGTYTEELVCTTDNIIRVECSTGLGNFEIDDVIAQEVIWS